MIAILRIPMAEDLFATLANDKVIAKLRHESQAYQQILLDFEISLMPGIAIPKSNGVFLRGILRVIVYHDDALITGSSVDEHF